MSLTFNSFETHPRDLIEAGVKVIGNTDFPSIDMESIDGPPPGSPIRLLYRGVTRTWAEGSVSEPWMLDQAITVDQALRLMTINAAYVDERLSAVTDDEDLSKFIL